VSIDAIAVLPPVTVREDEALEGEWHEGEGPGGTRGAFRRLRDGILVNLGLSIRAPNADLFEAARRWTTIPPERVWVFPDTAVPENDTVNAVRAATHEVGRWVEAGPARSGLLEDLGLTPVEISAFLREMSSGDPKRIASAVTALERRIGNRDPAQVEALLTAFLQGS
jgi:hypothetical protein